MYMYLCGLEGDAITGEAISQRIHTLAFIGGAVDDPGYILAKEMFREEKER